MTRILVIAALFLLTGCGSTPAPVPTPAPTPPLQYPSAPHWLMRQKSYAEYAVTKGTGVFVPASGPNPDYRDGAITVNTDMASVGSIRITNLAAINLGAPAIARTFSQPGVQVDNPPADFSGCLVQQYDPITLWIGESGGNGSTVWPPEPVSPMNPVAGNKVETTSTVTPGTGPTFLFVSESQCTVATVGAVKTTLIEAPSGIGQLAIYMYEWDGELRYLAYGPIATDNTINPLVIYQRTLTGTNT